MQPFIAFLSKRDELRADELSLCTVAGNLIEGVEQLGFGAVEGSSDSSGDKEAILTDDFSAPGDLLGVRNTNASFGPCICRFPDCPLLLKLPRPPRYVPW